MLQDYLLTYPTMNHRKIRSQGYIPFSWEEKPGIPKFNHQKSSSDVGLTNLNLLSDHNFSNSDTYMNAQLTHIAPPPPCTFGPPRKSRSRKSIRWEDDPFLAALKSCTKSVVNRRGYEELRQKKDVCKENKFSKSTSVFSCKQSCNVENDNLVKLPPIPKERYNAKSFVRNQHFV